MKKKKATKISNITMSLRAGWNVIQMAFKCQWNVRKFAVSAIDKSIWRWLLGLGFGFPLLVFCVSRELRAESQHLLADGISYSFSAGRHLPRWLEKSATRQPRRSKPFEHLANICALLSSWLRGGGGYWGWRRGGASEGKSTTSWRQLCLHKCMRMHLHFCGGLAQLPMAFGQVIAACCFFCGW